MNNAARNGACEPKRISDRDHGRSHLKLIRIPERGGGRLQSGDRKQRQIAPTIDVRNGCPHPLALPRLDGHIPSLDYMRVRNHTLFRQHHSRAVPLVAITSAQHLYG
jgi:hypothetical protein